MIENILIGVFAVIILGGAVAAWWIENGPEKKDKNRLTIKSQQENEDF